MIPTGLLLPGKLIRLPKGFWLTLILPRATRELQEPKAIRGQPVPQELRVIPVQQAQPEPKAIRGQPVPQELRVIPVQQAQPEPKAIRVLLVRKGILVLKAIRE